MRSLFWKIFASVFLANVLVMGLTTYIAFEASHSDLAQQHHQKLSKEIASSIIQRYEDKHQQGKRLKRLQHRFEIYTASGQHVFGHIGKKHRDQAFQFSLKGDNGQQQYKIISKAPKLPRGIERILHFTQSVRFVLVLLASLIVSFLLSLFISRPLKQLGQHARDLAQGELHSRVEQALLKRGDEIGELSRELNDMAGQLDRLINSKQQLLHNVSHELRAPLARLQTVGALMQQHDAEDSNAQRISRECQRMNGLIESILHYSRLQDAPQLPAALNLSTLLQALAQDIQYESPSHPIQFLALPETALISADADSLHSALENILRNACKYTPAHTAIDIELNKQPSNWHIRIRDHGPGVSEEELEKLCQPFYRGQQRMHGEGFGLGLSIARAAIEQQAGQFSIGNHPDTGLQIDILLPLNS